MVELQKEALDKAHALKLANNLMTKDPSELCSIAVSNPVLIREWIEELTRWREQSRRDTDLLHEVMDKLSAAQRLTIREVAA